MAHPHPHPIEASHEPMFYTTENHSAIAGPSSPVVSLFSSKVVWLSLLLLLAVLARVFGVSKQKLPAGVQRLPRLPGLPWAGRFWDIPESGIESAWHFGNLHKKYGPIYEWKVMGTLHIWVETDKIARDLFVNRQRIYCDRNELPAAIGVREGSEILPLMAHGEQWRRYKNFMHLIMRHSNPKAFYGWPAQENTKTLRRLLEEPERWSEHMLVHAARTIAGIAWAEPEDGSKLMTIIPTILKGVSPAGPIINKLTFLSKLPASISPWKKEEARRKQEMTDAFCEALQGAKERFESGSLQDCWSKLWLEQQKGTEMLDSYEAAHAIGSSSFVGIATIGGPLHVFFLAMCHYPSWQRRAQDELDRVCGDRQPTIDDMPRLPVVRAVVKELLRWRQSTPLGVPHGTIEDDVYEGYFIPKGAIVHANHYLIAREPTLYPDPEEYRPERWLEPSWPTYKEPLSEFPNFRGDTGFGYGNRSCPGIDLVQNELSTLVASILWGFNITRREGRNGYDIPLPWYETAPWVITMAKPFPCDLNVRSEERRRWIMNECQDAGYMIKATPDQCKDRWDVSRKPGEALFAWDGLTDQAPTTWRSYAPGV